jgi:hypothetical protein
MIETANADAPRSLTEQMLYSERLEAVAEELQALRADLATKLRSALRDANDINQAIRDGGESDRVHRDATIARLQAAGMRLADENAKLRAALTPAQLVEILGVTPNGGTVAAGEAPPPSLPPQGAQP